MIGRDSSLRMVWNRGYFRLFTSALTVFANICLFTAILKIEPSDKACVTSHAPWSPLLNSIEYHWTTYLEVGFLIRSKYLGTPSAEVEAAWDDLFPEHAIPISVKRLPELGLSLQPDMLHSSEDKVLAYPEMYLQLSCLNLLRQHVHRDQYNYTGLRSFQGTEGDIMGRVDQCLQRLRRTMTCWADTTPILWIMNNETKHGGVDLETLHYCRDHEEILQEARRQGVHTYKIEHAD